MKHERGVVSAVSIPGKLNSDGAQFFVCVSPQPALDGKFSAFGRVTEGMDVVEKISQSPVDGAGLAVNPVRLMRVTIEKKKVEPFLNATPEDMRKVVALRTTLGTIRIQMEPGWAPNHVRNFLKLTATGWFDGTAFHRIVKGFVVQGGMGNTRPNGAAHWADRWVRELKGEFRDDVKHVRGVVSMAHGDNPGLGNNFVLPDVGRRSPFGRQVLGLWARGGRHRSAGSIREGRPKRGGARRRVEIVEARIE